MFVLRANAISACSRRIQQMRLTAGSQMNALALLLELNECTCIALQTLENNCDFIAAHQCDCTAQRTQSMRLHCASGVMHNAFALRAKSNRIKMSNRKNALALRTNPDRIDEVSLDAKLNECVGTPRRLAFRVERKQGVCIPRRTQRMRVRCASSPKPVSETS